jgi:hypothetical protein
VWARVQGERYDGWAFFTVTLPEPTAPDASDNVTDVPDEGADRGNDPAPTMTESREHVPWWRLLTTVGDVAALLADRLQPTRDRLHKARWILWRQIHRARAQISHYHRRGEQPPAHLRGWARDQTLHQDLLL